MKPAKLRREDKFIDEIVETLKSVPKTRLRVVRDVIGALAEAPVRKKAEKMLKRAGRKSLLKTPFCGLWQGRTDIGNGQSYAQSLRHSLESRGDSN